MMLGRNNSNSIERKLEILFNLYYNYVRIKCLLITQTRKLLISSSKMRDYILKKREVYI